MPEALEDTDMALDGNARQFVWQGGARRPAKVRALPLPASPVPRHFPTSTRS